MPTDNPKHKVRVAGLALVKLGQRRITSFEQLGSNQAKAINDVWDDILEEVLSEHPWSFAQKRVSLSYVVPDDVSRTIEVDEFTPVAITGATAADPVVITADNHGLQNGDKIIITGVSGMTELNGNTYYVANKTNDTFELQDEDGEDIDGDAFTAYTSGGQIQRASHNTPITITAATKADPVVITTLAAHGLAVNDWVKIIGVLGMTDLNDNFYQVKAVPSTTSFSLKETASDDAGDDLDGTGFGAYTHGGVVIPCPEMVQTDTGTIVVYRKPSDLIKPTKKSDPNALVKIEQDKIISNVEGLKIKYTAKITDVDKWFAQFTQAVATRLAAEVAFDIVNSVAKAKELLAYYHEVVLPKALSVDSTQGDPDEPRQDDWLDAQIIGSNFPQTTGETWHPA